MEQYKMNGVVIKQPLSQMQLSFETTYSEDTGRPITGGLVATPLYTVEAYSYEASGLTISEMAKILQIVAKGHPFTLHYFSPYYGLWRDDDFYVGKGTLVIGHLDEDSALYDRLSFNVIGVNPID